MDMFQQEAQRQLLYGLLGELPDRHRPIPCVKLREEEREHYTLETLSLDLNGLEPVPAYFMRPHHAKGRLPTILYNHAHGSEYEMGKEEFVSQRGGLQKPPYAEEFAKAGYAAMCIDTWAFGERRGRTESTIFKDMLWHGQVMWGMMVYDSLRAMDYLVSREDVDASRIGSLGLSMGSTMAWWLAALDTRVKVCVDLLCLSDFHSFLGISNGLDGHGVYYFVPSLLRHFNTASINALIAPRAHLALAGNYDALTPPKGLDRIDAELRRVYAEAGAPDAWQLLRYNTGHYEIAAMRHEAMKFLKQWL